MLWRETSAFTFPKELFVQRNGDFGTGSSYKTGSATVGAISVQGKLTHHQKFSGNILYTQIHHPVRIIKNAQSGDFFRQIISIGFFILDQTVADRDDGVTACLIFAENSSPMSAQTLLWEVKPYLSANFVIE